MTTGKQQLTGIGTEQLEQAKREAADPEVSKTHIILGDETAPARLKEIAAELEDVDNDTERKRDLLTEQAELRRAHKRVKVRVLNLKAEGRILALLKPHMHLLDKIEAMGLDGGSVGLKDFGEIAAELAEVLPGVIAAAWERDGVTVDWLEEFSDLEQLFKAAMEQLKKTRLMDLLGKR